jgi:hypothetical protein
MLIPGKVEARPDRTITAVRWNLAGSEIPAASPFASAGSEI